MSKNNVKYLLVILLLLTCYETTAQETPHDKIWQKAINGDSQSQSWIADRFYWGSNSTQKNYRKAAEWYMKAASHGIGHAQYMLGWMYEHGEGVEKDLENAFKWYSNGAVQNNPGALTQLGLMYFRGSLYRKDYYLALKYFSKGAELGSACSQYMLGWMLQYGYGTPINKIKAKEWYTKAAEQNDPGAIEQLKLLSDVIINKADDNLATITWLSPEKSSDKRYYLKAGVNSKTQIEAVRISVNGETFRGSHVVKNDGYSMLIEQEIFLNAGENVIEVSITNTMGTSLNSKEVIYEEEKNYVQPLPSGKRVALVIGNATYSGQELKNPTNDASDIAAKLSSLGFKVTLIKNASMEQMDKAINDFGNTARESDAALFYFAGHGVQVGGMNYMIPIGEQLLSEEQTQYRCTNLNYVLSVLEKANSKMNIIILDACRNNPFERSWHRGVDKHGLSVLNAPYGTLLAYATNPGDVAADGEGRNSPYTEALLNALSYPGLKIYDVFQKISERVSLKTNNKQHPWFSASLSHADFYFNLPQ